MVELHKDTIQETIPNEPEKENVGVLCRTANPYFSTDLVSEENQALECLSDILVESFIKIKKKQNEHNKLKQKEGGNILQSINQRTG